MIDKIVMRDSPEAAQFRTDISGWVARNNPYAYQGPTGEEAARYHGCTHEPCSQCGAVTKKHYSRKCDACRELADIARYQAMPRAEWDGKAMLYSEATDRYYTDLGEVDDHLEAMEERCTLADLRLVICEPTYARKIDPSDYADELPADGELPNEVYEAIEEFNTAVDGIVLSWSPGKTALQLWVDGKQRKRDTGQREGDRSLVELLRLGPYARDGAEMLAIMEQAADQIERMRETLQGIAEADWRTWDELASPHEFVSWAKNRARHTLLLADGDGTI